MALAITKNDIRGVYGNPAQLKITKSDISSVYAKREKPKQPVILRATPEESHSHKGGALRSDRQNMRYFTPLRSTQHDTPGQSSVILKLPKAARESHPLASQGPTRPISLREIPLRRYAAHKTATLSDTSPFTITKSDISTVYSAQKTADAKTDRIHKMYSDYVKKQEEEVKSNTAAKLLNNTYTGIYPSTNIISPLQSYITHVGYRKFTKGQGKLPPTVENTKYQLYDKDSNRRLFEVENHPLKGRGQKSIPHINTMKSKEAKPSQKKYAAYWDEREVPKEFYDTFHNFDEVVDNVKTAGKAIAAAGVLIDTIEFADTVYSDLNDTDGKLGKKTLKATAGIAGEWGGSFIGAKLGAMGGASIGSSVFMGPGTLIGGFIGGTIGGIIGAVAGDNLSQGLVEKYYTGE